MLSPPRFDHHCRLVALSITFAIGAACAKNPDYGTAGTGGGGSGGAGGQPVATCSDPQAWTPPPAPAACADAPPVAAGTANIQLTVDAGTVVQPWNRFYEKVVASDHAHTVLCTAYGRNTQNALRKAHAQAGFQYVRFHGIFDEDVGVYREDPTGDPIYDWSGVDAIYDAVTEAGMRPLVEISFTPDALASMPDKKLTYLVYNGKYPNISPPTGRAGDWGKWTAFMTEFVRHLEDRYGADEIRGSWYFEVWNEPSWMYTEGDAGYFELYKNTVAGLVAGDPQVRVGGPAGSSGESPSLIATLVAGALNTGTKLDFITYHRYGDDDGLPVADVADTVALHATLVNKIASINLVGGKKFTGEVLNDEFGPSYKPDVSRDSEVAASFIVKTVHLLGSNPAVPPPSSFGYWAISDLYEEIDTGVATAFREGNFGLLLKGDPKIPESFDVAKPAFNAFRLLHAMGGQQLGVTGGTTGDGVGAAATRSAEGDAVQVLVYNHVSGGQADSSTSSLVSLTVSNLPFSGPVRVRQTIVDRTHANAYRAWTAMGSPVKPTQAQWITLRDAAELCTYETTVAATGGSATVTFPQNVYGLNLIELTASPG